MICTNTGLGPELIESLFGEVVVELAGVPVASDHAVLQDAEGCILERAMIKARGGLVDAHHRPTLEGGVLACQFLTLVMAQPFRRTGAVGKPLCERLIVTMPGRDPQGIVCLPDVLASWVVVAAPELEALLPISLGDVEQPANSEIHLGALALHPIEQLLDVDPRPVKLQGSPLRSSDDPNQPCFVAMFLLRLIGRMKSGP